MKNKSLRFKLYTLSAFLIVISIIVGGVAQVSEKQILEEYNFVVERNLPNIKAVGLMVSRYRLARSEATALAVQGLTKEEAEHIKKIYYKAWEDFEVEHKKYNAIPFSPGEDELYQEFKRSYLRVKATMDKIISLHDEGEENGSIDHETIANLITKDLADKGTLVNDAGNKLMAFHEQRADYRVENAKSIASLSTIINTSTVVIGGLVGIIFATLFSNGLINTLTKIGHELNEAGERVSAGAGQIASTAQELSQSTSEQSASLQETAASIEEMSSIIQKSEENAKKTYEVATNSKDSAVIGKDVVVEMINSIEAINSSNQDIMIAIETSNKKMEEIVTVIGEIGDKTKVINDIVFQTKLLSFNASVEAARAGEMGKGFAVVAEEVGNLAQMSGNAAKEISEMLTASMQKVEDIVKTTKSSVERQVEDGKKKVEAGIVVAKKCEEVLDMIVANIDEVNQLANEIAVASEEQSKGIQEISKAAAMLETITQQNVTASEDSASASEELSRQAHELNHVVSELMLTIHGGAVKEEKAITAKETAAIPNNVVMMERKPMARLEIKTAKKSEVEKPKKAPIVIKRVSGEPGIPSHDDVRFEDA